MDAMDDRSHTTAAQLTALAQHVTARRDAIVRAWRIAVDRDPELTTGAALPRTQLNDHIPQLLEAYCAKLSAAAGAPVAPADESPKEEAAAHGLQRWQQGYDLREVTREWGRLQLCVADELESYATAHPDVEPQVMVAARRAWTEMCAEGVSESTAQYFRLQQIEATGHVRDLQQALDHVHVLERQRAELWREAAHDLRGNLGVVVNAAAGLSLDSIPEQSREKFLRMLNKNVSSLHSMLEDVMSLARLQAGHEQRRVKSFDAAAALRELCERMQPLLDERDLYLNAEGPDELVVEGDSVKVQRIAQNLLLNAFKYTPRGGVTVTWGDSRHNDAERWMLCVQDTGPGFHAGPGSPLAGALEEATAEARNVEDAARGVPAASDHAPEADPGNSAPSIQERGEGVGLSIVKRLCDLLNATIEMESEPGTGTTMRVLFPRHYGSP
jgi:signal transduction histidine kinase